LGGKHWVVDDSPQEHSPLQRRIAIKNLSRWPTFFWNRLNSRRLFLSQGLSFAEHKRANANWTPHVFLYSLKTLEHKMSFYIFLAIKIISLPGSSCVRSKGLLMASKKKKPRMSIWLTVLAALLLMVFRELSKREEKHSRPASRHEKADTPSVAHGKPGTGSSSESTGIDEMLVPTTTIRDFNSAKDQLRKLFSRGRDFYCNCSYDFSRRPQVDPSSCGLTSKAERAKRIEWEHVVPASFYGRQFTAWKKGDPQCRGRDKKGRECARKVSSAFRQIEGDLYNLVPAVGELNRVRGDSAYGEVPGEPREFGACDFEAIAHITEPRSDIRGDIARIYFYMDARYPDFKIINEGNQRLFEEWAAVDPIDAAERERVRKIEAAQGNSFFIGRLSKAEGRTSTTRLQ
jgi:deoxyribonuclease-1